MYVFVGVVVAFDVVVAVVSIAIATIISAVEVVIVVLHVGAVVVTARHVGLLGVVESHAELYGSLASEPACGVVGVVHLVVRAVGLRSDGEHLAVADGHEASVFAVLAEQVSHGEVVELESDASDDTRLSPSE